MSAGRGAPALGRKPSAARPLVDLTGLTPVQAQLHEAVHALARRLRLSYLRAQLLDTLATARSQRCNALEIERR